MGATLTLCPRHKESLFVTYISSIKAGRSEDTHASSQSSTASPTIYNPIFCPKLTVLTIFSRSVIYVTIFYMIHFYDIYASFENYNEMISKCLISLIY